MRMLSKGLLALGLIALISAPASAQGPRGGRGFGGGGYAMLLGNASVQQELKLDEGQVEKAKDLAQKSREKMQENFQSLQSLEGEERFAKMRELNAEMNKSILKGASEFLKDEQIARLHQIHYQSQGANAFGDEHLQKKLNLTDDQKGEIKTILADSQQQMRSIFQESQGDREAAMAKMGTLRKETLAKVEAKLTADQKASYEKLLGSPFEIKMERRQGN